MAPPESALGQYGGTLGRRTVACLGSRVRIPLPVVRAHIAGIAQLVERRFRKAQVVRPNRTVGSACWREVPGPYTRQGAAPVAQRESARIRRTHGRLSPEGRP